MKKKRIPLEEKIYILKGEETENQPFVLIKSTTTKITEEGKKRQTKPKTNLGLLIAGEKSEIDFASLFYPVRQFELSGVNRPKGHSVLEKMLIVQIEGPQFIVEPDIEISFYDKKTGKEVKVIEIKTPLVQMSDEEIELESFNTVLEFIRAEHKANLKRKAQEEKEQKFGVETAEYIDMKNILLTKGWKEHKNGKLRLFKKNLDSQMFLIIKNDPGYREIETDENEKGEITFSLNNDSFTAKETEDESIKITKLEIPHEKPAENT